MTPSIALAERIRDTTKTRTDYAVAKALGVTQTNLKQILEGKRGFGTEACVRAAEILRVPVEQVLAEIELPRARTAEKKAFWEKRLPRILPAMAIWGLIAGVNQFTGVVRSEGLTTTSQLIHYAQRLWALIACALGRTAYGLGRCAA